MVYLTVCDERCSLDVAEHIMFKDDFEPDRTDKEGSTHLMYAAKNRASLVVFRTLVEMMGCDVNKVNDLQ